MITMSSKCTACRKEKEQSEFMKNGKLLKTCINCRDKAKNKRQPPAVVQDVLRDNVTENHKNLMKEFYEKTGFACHKYNTKLLMADIRDQFSPSLDRCYSYHSSSFLSLK